MPIAGYSTKRRKLLRRCGQSEYEDIFSILSGSVFVDVVLHVIYIADLTVKVHAVLYNYTNVVVIVVVIVSLTRASIGRQTEH